MNEEWTLASLVTGWCALHSLLIAAPLTRSLQAWLGSGFRFQRLAFNLIAVVTLIPVLRYRAHVAGDVFFDWSGAWMALRVLLIGSALLLFAAGGRHYDLMRFLGVRQLLETSARPGLTSAGGLDKSGILGFVRHPWYLAALLLIWARDLDWSVAMTNAVFSVYLVVGTLLEERKLVAELGDEYREYRRRVPMLVPRLRGRR